MHLNEKGVIVTGAGSGIGEAVARVFAQKGARVVTVGRSREKLDEARSQAGDAAERIFPFAVDVSDQAGVERMRDFAIEKIGQIDILVNNAGTNVRNRSLDKLTPEDFDLMSRINLSGAFYCIHAVLPGMRARQDGLIVNVSSIAGVRASVMGGAGYNASKHGMSGLSMSVGLEEGGNGIRCCLVCPGEVNTPILENRAVVPDADARAKMLQPEDLAHTILMVASLHPRANIPELIITPTIAKFS